MGKQLLSNRTRFQLIIPAGAIILLFGACNSLEESPSVIQLIRESTTKRAIAESTLLRDNPMKPSDIPPALDFLNANPNYRSYHLLLAIRRYYPNSYSTIAESTRAQILVSALQHLNWLNDWGYLHPNKSFDGESAIALLETRNKALPYLRPLLDDDSKAPLFGSEIATVSTKYNLRRKDFAFRYISLILGDAPTFHQDPIIRDQHIATLKTRLHQ